MTLNYLFEVITYTVGGAGMFLILASNTWKGLTVAMGMATIGIYSMLAWLEGIGTNIIL